MKLFVFAVLLAATLGYTQAIKFSECGKSVNCAKIPIGCTSDATCKAIASFKYDSATQDISFELTTSSVWAVIGHNTEKKMAGTRGVSCERKNGAAVIGFVAPSNYSAPPFVPRNDGDVAGFGDISTDIVAHNITCRFKRKLSLDNKYSYDLSTNTHLAIMAVGDELTKQHTDRDGISNLVWNPVVTTTVETTTTNTTTKAPTTTTTTMTPGVGIDLGECGKTWTCIKLPAGCTSHTTCEATAAYMYKPTTNKFTVVLSSKNPWVAFGQNSVPKMSGTKGAYCKKMNDKAVTGFFAASNGQTTPNFQPKTDVPGAVGIQEEFKDGVISCRFERALELDDTYSFALNEDRHTIIAYGNLGPNDIPAQHSARMASAGKVTFKDTESASFVTKATGLTTLVALVLSFWFSQ